MQAKTNIDATLVFWLLILAALLGTGLAQSDLVRFSPGARANALGGSLITEASDPTGLYWNPAATADINNHKILLSLPNPYTVNYIGYSHFFPLSGTASIALAQTSTDSGAFDIGTIGWSSQLTRYFYLGLNFGNYRIDKESWNIMGLGFLFKPRRMPVRLARLLKNTSFWERSFLADHFALGFSIQNIPLGDRQKVDHQARLGMSFRYASNSPALVIAQHFNRKKDTIHSGLIIPIGDHFQLLGGVNDLDLTNFSAGLQFSWENLDCDLTYIQALKRLQVSFTARLGQNNQILAEREFESAIESIKQYDYRQSLHHLRRALAYDPYHSKSIRSYEILEQKVRDEKAHIDSLVFAGQKLETEGQFFNAAANYIKILKSDPENETAKARLALIGPQVKLQTDNLYKSAIEFFDLGEFIKAKEIFEKILLVREEHGGAQIYLKRINHIFNEKAEEYYLRGLGFYSNKNYSRAEQEFKNALFFKPTHEKASQYLAKVQKEANRKQLELERLFENAERLRQNGDYVGASRIYDDILRQEPGNKTARDQIAQMQAYIDQFVQRKITEGERAFNDGNYQKALAAFNAILSVRPNDAAATSFIRRTRIVIRDEADKRVLEGKKFFASGKYKAAQDQFESALNIDPDHSEARELHQRAGSMLNAGQLIEEGKSEFLTGHYLKAKEIFLQVLADNPQNPIAMDYFKRVQDRIDAKVEEHFNRGIKFYTEEKYKAAIEEWKKALELNPDHKGSSEYTKRALDRLDALGKIQ